ncbi:SRPBCC family protein [Streptomyces albidoflavus]|uniref:SRPBCC family protein n=1 Tax=Streptomyces albidoflavus TaxID=1886 RepID=UPI0033F2F053
MEHEVFVPVPAEALRAALRAPATAVRGVPGLQLDPPAEGGPEGAASALTGRLRLRLDGRTITYRGTLRLTTEADGTYVFEVEGGEARGTGHGRATVRLRLTPAEGGTRVVLEVRSRVEGRGARLDPAAAERGARALLTQAVEALAGEPGGQGGASGPGPAGAGESADGDAGALLDAPVGGTPVAGPDAAAEGERPGENERPEGEDRAEGEERAEVSEDETADEEPKSQTPAAGLTDDDEITPEELAAAIHSRDGAEDEDEFDEDEIDLDEEVEEVIEVPDIEPAEAAHARRTMIGRSAEEVDHAPPRGRYAPVPAPSSSTTSATLRWAAPAAALVVASAVVVGRALRRRSS